jgi:hypothetical protein
MSGSGAGCRHIGGLARCPRLPCRRLSASRWLEPSRPAPSVRSPSSPRRPRALQVVDCGSFLKDWATRACLAQRPDLGEGGGLRPVVDLLVEQIE